MSRIWKKPYEVLRKSKQCNLAQELIDDEIAIEKMESEIGVLGNDGRGHDPHAKRPFQHNVYGPTKWVDDPDQGRVRQVR